MTSSTPFKYGVCFIVMTSLVLRLKCFWKAIRRFSQSAPRHGCQTHSLTCDRCLRYPVDHPDQLESGPHFMTAVRVHVDHFHRKRDQRQNPKASDRVYAWAYSSGHCRISHQVSSWIAYCNLTVNCVTRLGRRKKKDGTCV